MEKIHCICKMRSLMQALTQLEDSLLSLYGVSHNEAMVMCCLGQDKLTAGDISQTTGIKSSHLSKVLRSAEDKNLVTRAFGSTDKRQIFFSLTPEAINRLTSLKCEGIPVPDILKPYFEE